MNLLDKESKTTTESRRFLEFFLGTESYAVDLLKIKEVITPPETTSIPKSPAYVCGLMNLRGLVLTVVDLRKKLGIIPEKNDTQSAVIIFDLEDHLVGAVVDSVNKVLNVQLSNIKPVPDTEDQSSSTHMLGVLQHENKLSMWIDPKVLLDGVHQSTKYLKEK